MIIILSIKLNNTSNRGKWHYVLSQIKDESYRSVLNDLGSGLIAQGESENQYEGEHIAPKEDKNLLYKLDDYETQLETMRFELSRLRITNRYIYISYRI